MSEITTLMNRYGFELPVDFSSQDEQEASETIAWLIMERWPERLAQFDYKGIEERDAYAGLIEYMFEMAADDIKAQGLKSAFDETTLTETVTFVTGGQQHEWRFSHRSKYVDKDVFTRVGTLMIDAGAGMFIEILDEDCEQFAYVPRDLGQVLISNPYITPLTA